ncbi:hypothetical protein MTP99_014193 [Tenebrio molitor]|nr:hypothetical protein MTP99_014193 [Tenebrio molitor]
MFEPDANHNPSLRRSQTIKSANTNSSKTAKSANSNSSKTVKSVNSNSSKTNVSNVSNANSNRCSYSDRSMGNGYWSMSNDSSWV